MKTNQLITPNEAAQQLCVTPQYVSRLCKSGKLPAISEKRGSMHYWYIDSGSPEYLALLERTDTPAVVPPVELSVAHLDWDEWEMLCTQGYSIVSRPLSTRTLSEYRRYIVNFFSSFAELSPTSLLSALGGFKNTEKHTSESDFYTAKRMLFQALMTVARYYVLKGHKPESFLAQLQVYRPKKTKHEVSRPCHTVDKVGEALKKLTESTYYRDFDRALNLALIKTMFYTGLRVSEVCSIVYDPAKIASGQIRVLGKGNKYRWVGITESARKEIMCYLKERPRTDSTALFVSSKGAPMQPAYVLRRMKRIGKKLGITLNPHSLRRSAITWMLTEQSMPLALVRDAVGHSSISVTDRYTRPTADKVVSAMKALACPI